MKTSRQPRTRNALQNALEGAFTKIARAQSKVWGVNIIPSGTKVATDGNTIYMPWNSDDLKDIPFDVLNGYLDHEVGHVCAEREHKEAGRPTPMERLRETTNPTVRALLNILEDIRIERQRGRVFPGVESNLRAANLRSVENWRRRVADGKADENFWRTLGSAIILKARGCDASWLPESFTPYMNLLAPEIEESNSTEWFSDVEALAYRMYNKVQEYAKQLKEEQERQEQEEQEQDDSNDEQEDNEDEEGEETGDDTADDVIEEGEEAGSEEGEEQHEDGNEDGDEQEDGGGDEHEDEEGEDGDSSDEAGDEAGDDSDEPGEDGDSGPDADGDDAADDDAADDSTDEQGGEGGEGDERGDEEGAEGDGAEGDDASGADADEEGAEGDSADADADGEQSDEASEEGEQGDADPTTPADDFDELNDGDDDDAAGQPGDTEGDDSDDASPSDASDDDDASDAQPGHDDDSDSDTVSGNRAGDGADVDPVDPETDQPMDLDDAGIEHADEALEDLEPGEDEDMIREEVGEEITKASDDLARNGSYIPDPGAVAKDEWITPDVTPHDVAEYAKLKTQVQQQVSALRAKLIRIVKARAQSHNEYDQEEGRLDVDALHQLRLGSKRIFSKTVEGETLDTAVEILVDLSGSMGYSNNAINSSYWARLTVIALGEALDAINVPFEIIGFHNKHGVDWDFTDGPYVHRLPFQFFIYKSFNENHKVARRRLVGITGMEENVDGEAVFAVAKRLAARPESRKLMFVFSDGSPCCPGLHSSDVLTDGSQHLLQVIKQVRDTGIVVFGLGLAHDGIKRFYGEKFSINISKLETMAEDIFKVVRSALLAGYNGGAR